MSKRVLPALCVLLLVVCLLLTGCAIPLLAPSLCSDGAPPRILQHPDCRRGICGYTCDPGRWKEPAR